MKLRKKRFNPSKSYNSIYRATDETLHSLTQAHAVSATLLAEIKSDTMGCAEVGPEARRKKNSKSGKQETVCLERQERGVYRFSYYKCINSTQLDNMAIENVSRDSRLRYLSTI